MATKKKAQLTIEKGKTRGIYHYKDDDRWVAVTMFEGMAYVVARLAATIQAMGDREDLHSVVIEVTLE